MSIKFFARAPDPLRCTQPVDHGGGRYAAQESQCQLEWSGMGGYWLDPGNTIRFDGHNIFHLRASYVWPAAPNCSRA